MGLLITAICVLCIGLVAVWFSPLRGRLLQSASQLSRFKFTCRVTVVSDETRPRQQSESLSVEMLGRIPTPCDNFDTDVCLEIEDVTAGPFHAEPVLSADPNYRRDHDAAFFFQTHNGQVPRKGAVLSRWINVATIPCHVLRFAYRGRRKLQCRLSVLSSETGEVLTAGTQTVEYVSCDDGYRQLQDRKLEILKASVQLAMLTSQSADNDALRTLWKNWLDQIGQQFPAATELETMLDDFQLQLSSLTIAKIAEPLLAFGESADRLSALELVLNTLAEQANVTSERADRLSEIAAVLEIAPEPFLAACQKSLLQPNCHIEDPSFLLGVNASMDQQTFRARLNEEYRKWNCRVTHPDKEIRRQADQMLTLIANLRSRRTVQQGA